MRKAVLKNFAKFIGKHLCWSLFLINLQTYKPVTLLKKDSQGYEYTSDKNKQNPGVVIYFHAISANLFLNSILFSHYYPVMRH